MGYDHFPNTRTLRRLDSTFELSISQNWCMKPEFQRAAKTSKYEYYGSVCVTVFSANILEELPNRSQHFLRNSWEVKRICEIDINMFDI